MQRKTLLQLNAAIFAVIAILHLFRFLRGWPASIAGWSVPVWLSVIAFLVAGALCWLNWMAK